MLLQARVGIGQLAFHPILDQPQNMTNQYQEFYITDKSEFSNKNAIEHQ